MDLSIVYASFRDELEKIGSELTEATREHIKSKNFAVSAKASNTGEPAYPLPDKAHARAALGFAAMHHDKKDLAEVRKDVEKKFPGMVKEKSAAFTDEMLEVLGVKQASTLENATELAGLGVLAVPGADTLQAKLRSHNDPEHWKKKLLLGEGAHAAADVGGLGILAAPEVHKLLKEGNVDFLVTLDELEKLGAISDDQARRLLDRLDQLDKNKPTPGQVGRYGALGAGAGAGALGHIVSRAIEGGERSVTRRSALGAAAAGAIGMGGVPLVRGALDRHAEKKTLKAYLHQEKAAATLDALQQAYKRIAPLRNKIKPSAKVLEHVMEAPTPGAIGIREMSALNGPGTLPRPAQMGMLRQRPAIMAENTRALGGTPEQVASMVEQGNAQVEGTRRYIGNAGGAILTPPGGLSGWAARANASGASPIVPPEGAAQQRAANILSGVHEGYERSTKSSPAPYFSHFSPSVIHKEHNMVAGLEGPGAEEGRKYFQGMRAGGEGPAHAEQLQVMYGDKAAPWATYGQGPKLPKAMRKDMIRNWPQYQEHERGKLRSLAEKGQQEVAPGGITFDEGKVAASAPTRGNFMMASDIPSFRAPRLDVAIQKDGAFEDTKKGTEKDTLKSYLHQGEK